MKVTVNGKRLFFDTSGSVLTAGESGLVDKPTLILLHGAPGNSDHTVFKPIFEELADIAQVIYLDLAGCGRSDDPADGRFSLESWADDLVGFCDALGIVKPIVLGNSAGGMVAGVYASRYPDHPSKVILSSTQAKLDTNRCLDMFERLGGPDVRAVAERALVTNGDAESLNESFNIEFAAGIGVGLTANECGIFIKPGFEMHPSVVEEEKETKSDFRMVKVRTPKGWAWRKVRREVDIEKDAE